MLISTQLFSPFTLRGLTLKNRIVMSPMCQYQSNEELGLAGDWHLIHYATRAIGGVGLILLEATAVSPEGRISLKDLGIWNEEQARSLQDMLNKIRILIALSSTRDQIIAPPHFGIQLAHSGMKARPSVKGVTNLLLKDQDLNRIRSSFVQAAQRAVQAGFDLIEIHMAHGYLLHEFLSPFTNKNYIQGKAFVLELVRDVRKQIPQKMPLFVRISATDWTKEGLELSDNVQLCEELKKIEVDLIDVSSGGIDPHALVPTVPSYQVPFAQVIKEKTGLPTGAVGLITGSHQAEEILQQNKADLIFLGRELLRNPYWPLFASKSLQTGLPFQGPPSYERMW